MLKFKTEKLARWYIIVRNADNDEWIVIACNLSFLLTVLPNFPFQCSEVYRDWIGNHRGCPLTCHLLLAFNMLQYTLLLEVNRQLSEQDY